MKVAVLSDIHGNHIALKEVIARCQVLGVEKYILLGDFFVKGPGPEEVFQLLQDLNVYGQIKGNTEEWIAGNLLDYLEGENLDYVAFAKDKLSQRGKDFIGRLAKEESISFGDKEMLLLHGGRHHLMESLGPELGKGKTIEALKKDREQYVFYGHTHHPSMMVHQGKYLLNPGSIGLPLDGDPRASFMILTYYYGTLQLEFHRVKYDVREVIQLAKDRGLPYLKHYEQTLLEGRL